jgi:glycerol kinase
MQGVRGSNPLSSTPGQTPSPPSTARQSRRSRSKYAATASWVKARVGFEESVELAGDVADQAASDFAVGFALGASPLGIGTGGWVIAQAGQDDQVQGLVELAVPGTVESNADR